MWPEWAADVARASAIVVPVPVGSVAPLVCRHVPAAGAKAVCVVWAGRSSATPWLTFVSHCRCGSREPDAPAPHARRGAGASALQFGERINADGGCSDQYGSARMHPRSISIPPAPSRPEFAAAWQRFRARRDG